MREIADVMKGDWTRLWQASTPSPADKATDVPRDVVLGWTAGKFAAQHDVYLGTTFADVNAADRTNPKGVLVSQAQDGTTYDSASLLDFGKTYYWRVDEVNAAPSTTIVKGTVWSFTAEPYAYPVKNITATASSAQLGMGPENTVNGSGLDASDQHGVDLATMWMSTGAQPNWIQYQFDRVYKLTETVGLELQSDHRELRRLRRQGREDRILDRRRHLDRVCRQCPSSPGRPAPPPMLTTRPSISAALPRNTSS